MLTLLLTTALTATAASCDPVPEPWPFDKPRRVRGPRDWRRDLSGAVWHQGALWLVRDKPGKKQELWRIVDGEREGWAIETDDDAMDLEALTVDANGRLLALDEASTSVLHLDTSKPGTATVVQRWGLAQIPGASHSGLGPEALVARDGARLVVGHQNGGQLYHYVLADAAPMAPLLAISPTVTRDVSALEVEPATGRLWVWHGGHPNAPLTNWLEIGELVQHGRWVNFCAQERYVYPDAKANVEGLAMSACEANERSVWLTVDGGKRRSLLHFTAACQ